MVNLKVDSLLLFIVKEILSIKPYNFHLFCFLEHLRNLYVGQEATARTKHDKRLVPNWERSTSRLYIVTLLIHLIYA